MVRIDRFYIAVPISFLELNIKCCVLILDCFIGDKSEKDTISFGCFSNSAIKYVC